uniref:YbjN domain-containing protein n=1 Tax=Sphingorhabdus sp. TaxID=1902408 RepID=UPI0037CC2593
VKLKTLILMSAGLMSFSGSARAQEGCPAGLICASKPETVAVGVQDAGFRAKVDKDDAGDPMIYSEASGFKFQILFYECDKGKECSSLQFVSYFGAEDDNTPEYANAWNAKTRFIRASVEKKELQLAYDITTTGGLNKANFTDVLEWWSAMLGEFALFVKEKKAL